MPSLPVRALPTNALIFYFFSIPRIFFATRQTGLLIGRPGPKPLLLRLAPTPTARPTQPAAHVGRNCGKLKVNASLLGEHVRQAPALLPGGLAVLGLYAFGPAGLPVSGTSALLESLAGAWATGWSGGAKGGSTPPPACLVFGWCSDTRRVAGRALTWPAPDKPAGARAAGGTGPWRRWAPGTGR